MGIVYTLDHKPTGRRYIGCSENDNAVDVKYKLESNLDQGVNGKRGNNLIDEWEKLSPGDFVFTVVARTVNEYAGYSAYALKKDLWGVLSTGHELFNARGPRKVRARGSAQFVDLTDGNTLF